MELRHLRYFVAVAEAEHVTRAAEILGMQQPPLSQRMRALEKEVGTRLFRRRGRGIALTEAGRSLLEDARAILARLEQARSAALRAARGEQGRLAVGFTSSTPFHPLFPRLLRDFRDAHPLVGLSLAEDATPQLVDALKAGRLDAAFIRTPAPEPDRLRIEKLGSEPLVAAVPQPQHEEAADAIHLAELAGEIFILYRRESGPGLHDAIVAACHRAGFSPRIGQDAPRIMSTLNLVAAGLGVTLVPASMQRMRLDGVAFRALRDDAPPTAPILLATRTGDTAPTLRLFLLAARKQAA